MKQLILLDRDGVINYDSLDYIKHVNEFVFIPKAIESIVRLTVSGYLIGIATNQSGVSRGLYSEDTLTAIHQKMLSAIEQAGGKISALEYCVHLPEARCSCRKPEPGLLLSIARQLKITLHNVPFVGDRISDIQAALAVGAKPVMVLSPMTDREALKFYPEVPLYASLSEYVDYLLKSK